MNCREAQGLISAERDNALGVGVSADLAAHLSGCASCRQMRVVLAEAAEVWRGNTASAKVPDAQMEWQKVRRRLNGEQAPKRERATRTALWWLAAPLGAAAALALVVTAMRGPGAGPAMKPSAAQIARTDSVEIGGDSSSAMVFVDDKSGWLVVWAESDKG